jgi:hypothetical protein
MTTQLLFTRAEVADALGTSTMTVIRLEQAGELTPIKFINRPAAQTRYAVTEVQALIERRRKLALKQARASGGRA